MGHKQFFHCELPAQMIISGDTQGLILTCPTISHQLWVLLCLKQVINWVDWDNWRISYYYLLLILKAYYVSRITRRYPAVGNILWSRKKRNHKHKAKFPANGSTTDLISSSDIAFFLLLFTSFMSYLRAGRRSYFSSIF